MSHTKRAWKLQEFVAHSANVNCLALGQKSGRVLVTGGEDRKVNLWAVGKPNCIMSLTGHTTPVESVRFGPDEEMVMAGSMSGALKIWDLEQAKIIRTLTGHKSSIRSLDFHPYGDYAASGSLDYNIKLWDIRRKGCIYNYKGHTDCVNCLRFSPDGKLIASGGADGLVKIWDLTAGKVLTTLNLHCGPVNVVEFHPKELLLGTGSSDKTIKFWDLETFSMVSSTDGNSTPIRSMAFHPDGLCLFSGGKDLLKVYGWEPSECHDSIPISWGDVADITLTQNQLIGASFSQTNVSCYVVDVQRVHPFGGVPNQEGQQQLNSSQNSSHNRKSFITERPPTQSSRQASVPKEEAEEPTHDNEDEKETSTADIKNPEDYREIFQPKSRITRSPTRKVEPFPAPPEDVPSEPEPVKKPPPARKTSKKESESSKPVPKAVSKQTRQIKSPREPPENSAISAQDFLPKSEKPGNKKSQFVTDESVLQTIQNGHDAMSAVMSSRSKNLQIVRAMWTSGNTKTALDSAISMRDPSVIVDLLNVLNLKTGLWNLDLCSSLLPQVKDLLNSKYESHAEAACHALKIILRNFGPVIKSNITSAPSIGVDLSREERIQKCNACYNFLSEIRITLEKKQSVSGKLGNLYKEVQILMSTMD
ncbi:katanin p80 WD40 repeat-containing subunit B1-like isoform X2 [Mytilus californianus]|uniref:katanin p80 WD40 repeat-containing subunit B1-like isoform X2 n=1 Tax=Mytilus californianus TaxID=6549 RepID=UPI0022486730|nr:katanin p80 WD40 repeat-containing subunit B1-like isoform X2 [Mytilus californianus]